MERPKEVVWPEALAFLEFGLSVSLAISDPIEGGYPPLDVGLAVLILALALWFTRWRRSIARKVLMVWGALGMPAGLYIIDLDFQVRPEELKWQLAFLAITVFSLLLLLAKNCRDWPNSQEERMVEDRGNDA